MTIIKKYIIESEEMAIRNIKLIIFILNIIYIKNIKLKYLSILNINMENKSKQK